MLMKVLPFVTIHNWRLVALLYFPFYKTLFSVNSFEEGRVYFCSPFEAAVHHGGDHGSSNVRHNGGAIVCIVRKQGDKSVAQLLHLLTQFKAQAAAPAAPSSNFYVTRFVWGWRDVSAVQSACGSSTGPG